MTDTELIEETIAFVRETLKGAEGGHDWFHIQRVFKNTLRIAKDEEVDLLVVSLGALLHDIADSKFHGGDEELGPAMTANFLNSLQVAPEVVAHVVNIVKYISYKSSLDTTGEIFFSQELAVVRDADRLDAMGAVGIARAFNYGGYKNRELHNPDIPPNPKMTKTQYKNSQGPTINHFYEKLLLLKDRMHTESGKKLAEARHVFMLDYLKQFYGEWNGDL
ncbi:MAG: HD domain-containing protein [Sediminicola sp.]|tara:strand:+ start:45113 stop:45772 length:660 start_codon:yes stop_codon:yes gene_type:complete